MANFLETAQGAEWAAAYAKEHNGLKPGEVPGESLEESIANLMWSRDFADSTGQAPTQNDWEEAWYSRQYDDSWFKPYMDNANLALSNDFMPGGTSNYADTVPTTSAAQQYNDAYNTSSPTYAGNTSGTPSPAGNTNGGNTNGVETPYVPLYGNMPQPGSMFDPYYGSAPTATTASRAQNDVVPRGLVNADILAGSTARLQAPLRGGVPAPQELGRTAFYAPPPLYTESYMTPSTTATSLVRSMPTPGNITVWPNDVPMDIAGGYQVPGRAEYQRRAAANEQRTGYADALLGGRQPAPVMDMGPRYNVPTGYQVPSAEEYRRRAALDYQRSLYTGR